MPLNETLVDACNEVHEGRGETAIQTVMEAFSDFPELARSEIVLPAVRNAAAQSQTGSHRFGRVHREPQIVEALEAPLTWIYGARVGVWSVVEGGGFFDTGAGSPRYLILAGAGPAEVQSRLAPNVADLASERNCPSDLVVAGFSRFDLRQTGTADQRVPAWTPDEFYNAVIELARSVAAVEAIESVGRDYIFLLAPQVLRPTVGMARQAFQAIEQEIGFVVNREIEFSIMQVAEARLAGLTEDAGVESIPTLAEYCRNGMPLEIELDQAFLGIAEYASVAAAYAQALRRQRIEEWERRRCEYQEWAMGAVHEWHALRLMSPADREQYSTLIHWVVNFETASRQRLDPPQRVNGIERLASLPQFIADNLAWWALAKNRIEAVSQQPDRLPWMDSYLMDAFLRGQPQPDRERELKEVYDRWVRHWRPIALHALDAALRKQGTNLAEVGVEQTVFQLVRKDEGHLVLRLLHVWDPSLDPLPSLSRSGVTLYHPRFAARRETFLAGREAQRTAMRRLDATLNVPVDAAALTRALSLDSGKGIDRLLSGLAERLQKDCMERDVADVRGEAVKIDPFLKCGLFKKLHGRSDLPTLIRIAAEFGEAGRRPGSVPDFRAWELYLASEAIRQLIANLAANSERLQSLAGGFFPLALQSAQRGFAQSIVAMSRMNRWEILDAARQQGPKRETVDSLLRFLQSSYVVETLVNALDSFRAAHGPYADRCAAVDAVPPRSEELEQCSVPNCFHGRKEVCYYLALGDAAAALAHFLLPVSGNPSRDELAETVRQLREYSIHDAFPDLHGRRQALVEEVAPYLDTGDLVSVEFATSKIRTAVSQALDEAAGAYVAAALRDRSHGVAWVRLAALKWSLGSYRDALRYLIGPAPLVNLLAARFPLALAVRLAGGKLEMITERTGQTWASPAGLLASVEGPGDDGKVTVDMLRASYPPQKIGRCVISSLAEADARLLADFFARYEPDLQRSAGRHSFEEWMSLVQVPSLGLWGSLAAACEQGAEPAVLAAAVFLGPPVAFRCPWSQRLTPRPDAWLDRKVLSSLEW